ncbi:MAG: bifunctional UDP-4-amino-4-deoxy-L-arabinose formyltransferase/UDP-glucuronic acid oxidase ArnA [Victivallales bacterium]|nr:bifunctional UDP-4-amino-4-deoxy-L-arabinose formyltransferase/UDP-glucuronic acid oxidase ArnA [Victivallales bacterium]
MKAVVLAYHNIGCIGIRKLLDAGIEIAAVFTHKDNPNENTWFDSVAELCAEKGLDVFAPEDINHPIWEERIRQIQPDILFSFYYRQMVRQTILDIPSMGCMNLHGSLLPKYRGRVPINWAVIRGEKETGVTLHYMTASPDAGDVVAQRSFAIEENDTAMDVHRHAAQEAGKLLEEVLPKIKAGTASRIPQNPADATYFHGRTPADGRILWNDSAENIRNLIRGVTRPYPGAFGFLSEKKIIIWKATVINQAHSARPGTVLAIKPLTVACGENALRIDAGQAENGVYLSGEALAIDNHMQEGMLFQNTVRPEKNSRKRNVLILGGNGFIGNAISRRLLEDGHYQVYCMDLQSNYISDLLQNPDFHFTEGDIQINHEWVDYHIRKCDCVLPLVAIATPIEYTRNPLRVFELDFEENLRIVRTCVKYRKRLIFPSTSEVYAMCDDTEFNEDTSRLILGPISKQRWIYSCSKQMLDRVIWAYGQQQGLDFTLFRPFNWIGPKLDTLDSARIGSSRAITQLILNLVQGTPILLIDGGEQKRCFTDVKDGVECLFRIIENQDGRCSGRIINIGNPAGEASIRTLAEILVEKFNAHPLRSHFPPFAGYKVLESAEYYGEGYQDCRHRKPSIKNAWKYCGWKPSRPLEESIAETLDFFLKEELASRN